MCFKNASFGVFLFFENLTTLKSPCDKDGVVGIILSLSPKVMMFYPRTAVLILKNKL